MSKALTKAQRTRKLAAAERRLREAAELLGTVCDDFSEYSYAMPWDEQSGWSEIAQACDRAGLAARVLRHQLGGE